jgi:hypothetical protein
MPRAGLGFEALYEVNPRLIYAQLSGLGYDGPYAGRGGFDLIAQGMGGIMQVTGEPDSPLISVGLPICDLGTGMWVVQASSPPSTSASTPAKASSSAHYWKPRSALARGPRRSGLPTTRSRPARARVIARTRPTSACRPRTAI